MFQVHLPKSSISISICTCTYLFHNKTIHNTYHYIIQGTRVQVVSRILSELLLQVMSTGIIQACQQYMITIIALIAINSFIHIYVRDIINYYYYCCTFFNITKKL